MPKKDQVVELLPINISEFEIEVIGTSPLIVHRFSEKAKKQIEDKQQKRAKQAKEARDPHAEYLSSLYVFPGDIAGERGARYGVPAVWFKLAMVAACRYVDGLTMTAARGAFHVMGESPESGGLVRLKYDDVHMREDAVTIGMGSRDMRYRAEFSNWSVKFTIRYNASVITPDQLINLLNVSGFGGGIGERRPSQGCSDQFGMFNVLPQEGMGRQRPGLEEMDRTEVERQDRTVTKRNRRNGVRRRAATGMAGEE